MGVKSGLFQLSAGYVKMSRYFFYGLVVLALLGLVTGAFAQSSQVQLTLSNVGCPATAAGRGGIVYSCHGTVTVTSQLKQVALRGNITVVTDYRNHNYTGGDSLGFSPSSIVSGPGTAMVNASTSFNDYVGNPTVTMYVQAYDPNSPSTVYATVAAHAGVSFPTSKPTTANLYILNIELPLFQVPWLGISASNPDFSTLFSALDQMPLGDFYTLLAEVAIIFLMGAGMINFILYLTGGGEEKNQTKTLAGLNNILITLVLIVLLPYIYNLVAGFVDILDQVIIAGPVNLGHYNKAYLAYINTVWGNLMVGGKIKPAFNGLIE